MENMKPMKPSIHFLEETFLVTVKMKKMTVMKRMKVRKKKKKMIVTKEVKL